MLPVLLTGGVEGVVGGDIWDLPNAVKLKNTIVESRPTHFLFNITVFILKGSFKLRRLGRRRLRRTLQDIVLLNSAGDRQDHLKSSLNTQNQVAI